MHVIVDPAKLASRRVTWSQLAAALERENRNFSGGDFDEGKRRYVVRTVGEYRSPADIEDIVVAVRDGVPVYLRDVAAAPSWATASRSRRSTFKGEPVDGHQRDREPGSNVLEVMDGAQGHGRPAQRRAAGRPRAWS